MNSYKELNVWQKSIDLVKQVYALTKTFPKEERYALTDQINRAVVSIPSNIAEGNGRNSTKDYIHFLNISRGSLYEVNTQMYIANQLGYITDNVYSDLSDEIDVIGRMLNKLVKAIDQ